jgi:hypothetical protein
MSTHVATYADMHAIYNYFERDGVPCTVRVSGTMFDLAAYPRGWAEPSCAQKCVLVDTNVGTFVWDGVSISLV